MHSGLLFAKLSVRPAPPLRNPVGRSPTRPGSGGDPKDRCYENLVGRPPTRLNSGRDPNARATLK